MRRLECPTQESQPPKGQQPHKSSAGADAGRGAGDIGEGTAKGVGKGAGDLVTLHLFSAAGNVGKGAAITVKDIAVGATKGTGRIAKGTGKGIGKMFRHHHKALTATSEPQN